MVGGGWRVVKVGASLLGGLAQVFPGESGVVGLWRETCASEFLAMNPSQSSDWLGIHVSLKTDAGHCTDEGMAQVSLQRTTTSTFTSEDLRQPPTPLKNYDLYVHLGRLAPTPGNPSLTILVVHGHPFNSVFQLLTGKLFPHMIDHDREGEWRRLVGSRDHNALLIDPRQRSP